MASEKIEFISKGCKLVGNLHLPYEKAPCVVLCHGLAGSKDSDKWLTLACSLEDEGYASLRFNFRGCGWGDEWSEGNFEDMTLTDRIDDYEAALDFLVSTGGVDTGRLGAIGSSLGSCTIIAANDPRPLVYVALATPAKFGVSPEMLKSFREKGYYENPEVDEPRISRIKPSLFDDLELYDIAGAVSKIEHPILFIHGSEDAITVDDARSLYDSAGEPKRLEIIEGAGHRFDDSGHLGEVIGLVLGWLKEYL